MKKKRIFIWILICGLIMVLIGAFLKIQNMDILGITFISIGLIFELIAIVFFLRSISFN